MSLSHRASLSGLAVVFQEGASRACSLGMAFLIARRLGPAAFGRYSFALTFAIVFAGIADFGLDTILTRNLSRSGPDARGAALADAVAAKTVLAAAAIGIAVGVAVLSAYPTETKILFVLAALHLVGFAATGGFATVFVSVHTADMSRSVVTRIDMIGRAALLAATWLLLQHTASLIAILSTSLAITLVSVIWLTRTALSRVRFRWRFDPVAMAALIRACAPLAVQVILGGITLRMGVFLLERWQGMGAVGAYASAIRLAESPLFVTAALTATLLPVVAASLVDAPDTAFAACRTAVAIVAIALPPVCVAVACYAGAIMTAVYTSAFAAGAAPLAIQVFATPIMLLNTIMATLVVAAGSERRLILINVSMFCAALVLNVICIRLWSLSGLGFAVLGTQLTGTIGYVSLVRRRWPEALPSGGGRVLVALAAFAVMLFAARPLPYGAGAGLATASYLGVLAAAGVLGPATLGPIVQLLRRSLGRGADQT